MEETPTESSVPMYYIGVVTNKDREGAFYVQIFNEYQDAVDAVNERSKAMIRSTQVWRHGHFMAYHDIVNITDNEELKKKWDNDSYYANRNPNNTWTIVKHITPLGSTSEEVGVVDDDTMLEYLSRGHRHLYLSTVQ